MGHHLIVAANQLHTDAGIVGVASTTEDGEVVFHALLHTHTEVAMILYTCSLLAVSVIVQRHIMRVAVKGGFLAVQLDIAEGLPVQEATTQAFSCWGDVKRCFK